MLWAAAGVLVLLGARGIRGARLYRWEIAAAAGALFLHIFLGVPFMLLAVLLGTPLAHVPMQRGYCGTATTSTRSSWTLSPRRWPRQVLTELIVPPLEAIGALLARQAAWSGALGKWWLRPVAHAGRWMLQPFRAASIERWWHRACANAGLKPGRVTRTVETAAGWRLNIVPPAGLPVHWLAEHAEHLASTFAAREVRVARDAGHAGRATVHVIERDTLAALAGQPWPLAGAERVDLWQPVPIGVDEDGEPVTVTLPEHNLLLGGEPGAGKTVAMQLMVSAASLDPLADLVILDGKEVDLVDHRDRALAFAGADLKEAEDALKVAHEWMVESFDRIRAAGRKKVQPGDPLLVVVCDELAYYVGAGQAGKRITAQLRDLVQRGRAAGVIVLAATQRPGADVIDTSLRDLFAYRHALRCTTPEASDMALGQGNASRGFDATSIPTSQRGTGYLLAEGVLPVRMRSDFLTDGDLAAIAARAGKLRDQPRVATPRSAPVRGACQGNGHVLHVVESLGNEPGNGAGKDPGKPVRDGTPRADLAAQLSEHLNGEPVTVSALARAVGREPSDGSVRRAVALLELEGRAVKVDGAGYRRAA